MRLTIHEVSSIKTQIQQSELVNGDNDHTIRLHCLGQVMKCLWLQRLLLFWSNSCLALPIIATNKGEPRNLMRLFTLQLGDVGVVSLGVCSLSWWPIMWHIGTSGWGQRPQKLISVTPHCPVLLLSTWSAGIYSSPDHLTATQIRTALALACKWKDVLF